MSEQGSKGGKGLGKGGVKRHGNVRQCDCVEGGTTKPAIRKLARCGGVKRLSGLSYDQPCDFVKNCVQDAQAQLEAENIERFVATYMEYGFFALNTQGRIRSSSELSSASSGSLGNDEKSN